MSWVGLTIYIIPPLPGFLATHVPGGPWIHPQMGKWANRQDDLLRFTDAHHLCPRFGALTAHRRPPRQTCSLPGRYGLRQKIATAVKHFDRHYPFPEGDPRYEQGNIKPSYIRKIYQRTQRTPHPFMDKKALEKIYSFCKRNSLRMR